MKKIIILLSLVFMSSIICPAQESKTKSTVVKKDNKISVLIKNSDSVSVYIDGKKFDTSFLELLDANKIGSISVLKDNEAMEKYGSPNVILIKTKEKDEASIVYEKEGQIIVRGQSAYKNKDGSEAKPVIIVDGELADENYLKELDPDDIYKISVYKDGKYKKKYNAEHGVIMIITKEQAKKEDKTKK